MVKHPSVRMGKYQDGSFYILFSPETSEKTNELFEKLHNNANPNDFKQLYSTNNVYDLVTYLCIFLLDENLINRTPKNKIATTINKLLKMFKTGYFVGSFVKNNQHLLAVNVKKAYDKLTDAKIMDLCNNTYLNWKTHPEVKDFISEIWKIQHRDIINKRGNNETHNRVSTS